jgi:hypothetical protein
MVKMIEQLQDSTILMELDDGKILTGTPYIWW